MDGAVGSAAGGGGERSPVGHHPPPLDVLGRGQNISEGWHQLTTQQLTQQEPAEVQQTHVTSKYCTSSTDHYIFLTLYTVVTFLETFTKNKKNVHILVT